MTHEEIDIIFDKEFGPADAEDNINQECWSDKFERRYNIQYYSDDSWCPIIEKNDGPKGCPFLMQGTDDKDQAFAVFYEEADKHHTVRLFDTQDRIILAYRCSCGKETCERKLE